MSETAIPEFTVEPADLFTKAALRRRATIAKRGYAAR